MKNNSTIKEVLSRIPVGSEVKVNGWIRTFRNDRFISLSDGTVSQTLQAVIEAADFPSEVIRKLNTGACISVEGDIQSSPAQGQDVELHVRKIEVLGEADSEKYPLQPKKHSLEFMRELAHLRPRTQTFGAVFRLRHHLAFAVHKYFNDKGFFNVHTPIITASDAEGAGEMFAVSTLDPLNSPKTEEGTIDYSKDFFGKMTNLTVSGQLEAELFAMGLSKVYTFGPTFRAENSNTSRHLAEFWMIEPEMAFYELDDNMDLAEDFIKYLIRYTLEHGSDDLLLLEKRLLEEEKSKPQDQKSEMGLVEKLNFVLGNPFRRVSYTEAIEILRECRPNKKKKFKYIINEWGADLQSEHERYLVEKHFNCPVILYDYPADIKAFYMRQNEDGKTVRAMDVLFPGIGEIIGGSQREERMDRLLAKMKAMDIPQESLEWYLDTRRFGACKHSGFGLGFERLVQFVTGMTNIRDVIPFPRTPGNAEF